MNKLFDLNEKVNLLYNFAYNQDSPNCTELDKINIKGISMNDIKVSVPVASTTTTTVVAPTTTVADVTTTTEEVTTTTLV